MSSLRPKGRPAEAERACLSVLRPWVAPSPGRPQAQGRVEETHPSAGSSASCGLGNGSVRPELELDGLQMLNGGSEVPGPAQGFLAHREGAGARGHGLHFLLNPKDTRLLQPVSLRENLSLPRPHQGLPGAALSLTPGHSRGCHLSGIRALYPAPRHFLLGLGALASCHGQQRG